MTFWRWFEHNGDKVFAFLAAAALALQGMSWMPPKGDHAMEVLGVLATIAHQIFFPKQPGPTAPKAE